MCMSDVYVLTESRIQFADEQYFVKEGDTLAVTLVRTGAPPTGVDLDAGKISLCPVVKVVLLHQRLLKNRLHLNYNDIIYYTVMI